MIKILIFLSLLIRFSVCFAPPAPSTPCTKVSGSGTCVSDGNKGCHVSKSTICEAPATPDGCRRISQSGSGPGSGYYVPYGNSTAWNAFKANMPAVMANVACPAACEPDGALCLTVTISGSFPRCNECCNSSGPADFNCTGPGEDFAKCGPPTGTCLADSGTACSFGGCMDY